MPSIRNTSKSDDVVNSYIRYLVERERKIKNNEIIEFNPYDIYFVGLVTKFLGNKRFDATDGTKSFQVRISGKFSGREKKKALVSIGCYVLLDYDDSIKSYDMKALIHRESVDIINKITPINPSLLVSSSDGKKDDGIEFDRSGSKDSDLEDVDIDKL
jgi:hypothetical protein